MAARVTVCLFLFVALPLHGDDGPPAGHPFPTFRIGGFADVVLAHPAEGGKLDYESGELDLFTSSQLSSNWSVLGEGVLQHAGSSENADLTPKSDLEVDLERLYVAYEASDRLRVEIGQIHTGIVQWNEREHRSRFLQTPIDVPSIANRESQGGAWPLHFTGAWASGRVPGSLGARYGVGLGTARGSERDDIQPFLRRGSSPAALFMVSLAPDAFTGFEAGATGYDGRIRVPQQRTLRELDATLYSSFVRGGVELRGEWARMVHSEIGGPNDYVTRGWYLLGSWRPRGRWKPLRPYLLIDHLHVAPGEQYLTDVHNQNAWSAGVRWDVNARLAFKGDFRTQRFSAPHREGLFRIEMALAF